MVSFSVASAPGKVLITGAYLVLEQPNAGLVLSTSARFYAIVRPIHSDAPAGSWCWSWADVVVVSPQLFKETSYKLSLRNYTLQNVTPSDSGSSFVEQAVQSGVSAARCLIGDDKQKLDVLHNQLVKGLEITIVGANDFYSFRKQLEAKGLPLLPSTLASLPPFSPITPNPAAPNQDELALPEVAKTGLGSSAAMTTAIVSALLHFLGVVSLPACKTGSIQTEEIGRSLDLVHAASQAAHCAAQGKIGSGFDVSAAVYGSQRYIRFSPSILAPAQGSSHRLSPLELMRSVLSNQWDGEKVAYGLPPSLSLIVGEPGFGGSHTPSMVGAVQKWRQTHPADALSVWGALATANKGVETGLQRMSQLSKQYQDSYAHVLKTTDTSPADKWQDLFQTDTEEMEVLASLLDTRNAFLDVRRLLQRMGESAGVPIEPPSQTSLLDATMALEGVLLAGVPGAGGYDAVFAITVGDTGRSVVEKEWLSRGVLSLCVLEDPHGVRIEDDDPRTTSLSSQIRTLHL